MKIKKHFSAEVFWKNDFENYFCPFFEQLLKMEDQNVHFYTKKNSRCAKKLLIYINEKFNCSTLEKQHDNFETYYYISSLAQVSEFEKKSLQLFPLSLILKKSHFSEWKIFNPTPSVNDCVDPVFNVLLANGAELETLNCPQTKLIFEEDLSFQHGIRIFKNDN